MLGLADIWIAAAFLLCILAAVAGVVYGWVNWNREGDDQPRL